MDGNKLDSSIIPPVAMGAIIIVIGLELVPVATKMCGFIPSIPDFPLDTTTLSLACGTLGVTALSSVLFRGFLKIIPNRCSDKSKYVRYPDIYYATVGHNGYPYDYPRYRGRHRRTYWSFNGDK